MTYFHMRMHTIIGAKSFHCPVRDGKEWDQLAMVVRHNWYQSLKLVSGPALDVILEEVKCVSIVASVLLAASPNVIGSSRTGN
jgi:hypothetical protein